MCNTRDVLADRARKIRLEHVCDYRSRDDDDLQLRIVLDDILQKSYQHISRYGPLVCLIQDDAGVLSEVDCNASRLREEQASNRSAYRAP